MGVFDTPFVISEGIQMGLIDQLLIPEFYDRIRRLVSDNRFVLILLVLARSGISWSGCRFCLCL